MAEEEQNKVTENVTTVSEPTPSTPAPVEKPVDAVDVAPQEKPVAPPPVLPSPAPVEEKLEDSKAIVPIVAKEAGEEKKEGSVNRDAVLARVETEKRMSLIKAWEEAEKCKVENKAEKKLSSIGSWENNKKAAVEAELKKMEEQLEKKKAEYVELMKNKIAQIHKQAEEKRAMIEARRGEEVLKAEELAAKYRATGTAPKKLFGCIKSWFCRELHCISFTLILPQSIISGEQQQQEQEQQPVAMAEQTEKAFLKQPKVFLSSKKSGKGKRPGKGGNRFWKNIGLGFKTPRDAIDGHYIDKKCPFTGTVSVRGRILAGTCHSAKMQRTIIVRRNYLHFVKKYQRYEKRHSNIPAHVSPCFRVKEGDHVIIGQCRPLSKTVRFNVLKVIPAGASAFAKKAFTGM
ncbi:hypothetical protein HID58_023304 [Brassica napus]|uniref:40S ribosomal protein S11 n=5 Tax=Brassiceae TaxID=981071 RepID=A0ABQ8D4C4_BRANA|nr:hypothetical protein HID58_023304 [Brassica napus]